MKNRHLYILSAVLAATGIGIFIYKAFVLNLPLRPDARVVNWEVQTKITFEARDRPVRLVLFTPQSEGLFTIVDQSFVSEGYGLTTRMSRGKANLHQGAIGAGVAMPTGRTLSAVLRNTVVTEHPDTYNPVMDVEIPDWDQLLDMAARSFELTNLGYQGIDIVLDKVRGPLVLELNARPGLNIQIANREGLRHRLERIAAAADSLETVADRVAFAKENFAPKPVGA